MELLKAQKEQQKIQEIIFKAQLSLTKVETKYKVEAETSKNLKKEVEQLKNQIQNDQLATNCLQKVLEERQRELIDFRNHYKIVEEAIQGTSYVNEIYERVQKAATDLNFEGQVSKHYEYQSQLDQMKQDLIAAQKQRDMLLSDN